MEGSGQEGITSGWALPKGSMSHSRRTKFLGSKSGLLQLNILFYNTSKYRVALINTRVTRDPRMTTWATSFADRTVIMLSKLKKLFITALPTQSAGSKTGFDVLYLL